MIEPRPVAPEPVAPERSPDEREAALFIARVRGTRPVATLALLGALAALFACEVAFGGSELSATLAHMGANVVERTRAGELDRVLTASTLHAGVMHVAMNLYVLYALGRVIEALLGRARFVVLYVLAALGGGLGTTLLSGAAVSVGASGAVWGLLGASSVLAFLPRGLVPARAIPGWRRSALTNLGLNVVVSFTPGIDLWAHLGGGLVGAALVGSGLLTTGLSLDVPPARSRFTSMHTVLASLLVLALVGSVSMSWARGRPWELVTPPTFVRASLSEPGLSLEVPSVLSPTPVVSSTTAGTSYAFGEIAIDPWMLLVVATPTPAPRSPEEIDALLEGLRAELDVFQPAAGAIALGPTALVSLEGNAALSRSFRYETGLVYTRSFVALPTHDVLLETLAWEAYAAGPEVGERAIATLAPLR